MSAEFPFTSSVRAVQSSPLPIFRMWAWDFANDTFKKDSAGNMILVEGAEALKIWIYKALRTQRFAYLAYSDAYGSEIWDLIGEVMSAGERRSEFRRGIVEALMVCPYIKSITNIALEETARGRVMNVNVTLDTVYGEIRV